MGVKLDQNYLLAVMKALIDTPSPVNYYGEINPLLERFAHELDYKVTLDRKRTGYIRAPGKDTGKTICIGVHLGTLGLIVYCINFDGMIRVCSLGSIDFNNIEGEMVVIHTRDGKRYTDLMAYQSHSVHVSDDARTLTRDENTMMVILDEDVRSKEDIKVLGIENDDVISIEPRFTIAEKEFIKSRSIDDKAYVAYALTVLECLKGQNLTSTYSTWFVFPHCEEAGHRDSYVPGEVSEYIVVDIAVVGPDHSGTKQTVSICVKDNFSSYDKELTDRLVTYARGAGIDYVEDVFYKYGTNASVAVRTGNDIQAATFGMGTFPSHGMERTHIKGAMQAAQLIAAFVLQNNQGNRKRRNITWKRNY